MLILRRQGIRRPRCRLDYQRCGFNLKAWLTIQTRAQKILAFDTSPKPVLIPL
jgi:hypothetical protein